jgi:hypothetical protein
MYRYHDTHYCVSIITIPTSLSSKQVLSVPSQCALHCQAFFMKTSDTVCFKDCFAVER